MPKKTKKTHTTWSLREERDRAHLKQGLLPVPVVAKMLGLSLARVYELAAAGTLYRERAGGSVYITKASLERYQRASTPGPGWIPMAEATRLYSYAKATLFYRAKRGDLELRLINRRAYLYQPALDVLFHGKKS